jgi:putative OPT family oligopeptide transporter
MESTTNGTNGLPENAYRELKEGEIYRPIIDPASTPQEVTPYSVFWGIVMVVIFSAAAAYSGLKIGQVMDTAIPIAILAVGLSAAIGKKNALGQNVIIQSIGSNSGSIVAGAIFTIPALYILDLTPAFYQIFLAALFGGMLGILFLIPFRKYFVRDMHGKFPFPEATATTEVLITGEKGGNQAMVLIVSGLIGGFYDFMVTSLGWWSEVVSSRIVGVGDLLATKLKMVFKINVLSMVFGLGYIIGLKYASIICAGSFLSWFVLVPLFSEVGHGLTLPLGGTISKLISDMTAEEIFRNYVRQIGIGSIAMAGIIGILRSSKIIAGAFKLAAREIFKGRADVGIPDEARAPKLTEVRTQSDLSMLFIVLGILLTALMIFVFFYSGVVFNLTHAFVGLMLVIVIAFLFTTVAANAIAIVGTNPVSGMTLMTLILSSVVLKQVGLSGTSGIVSGLIIGGVVCTALSMSGAFITDLKIGYWLGSTPKKQETWKFLGTLVAAATVGLVIQILNQTYGFKGPNALVAPQANAMAAVIQPLMSDVAAPWMLYALGAVIALLVTWMKIPPLAFALGMYIPLELNTPLLVGGLVAWFVSTRSKNEKLNSARAQRGTLIASGLIAGGSLFGVIGALVRFADIDLMVPHWAESHGGEMLGVGMFLLLVAYALWDSMRAKEE